MNFFPLFGGRPDAREPSRAAAPESERYRFDLTSDRVRTFQIRAIAMLILASTAGQILARVLDTVPGVQFVAWFLFVDNEQTLPTLYSTAILFCCAGLAAVVGWAITPVDDRAAWRTLAVIMAVAGFDEYAAIHERAIDPLRDQLAITSGPLYYAWIVPGALVVVVLAMLFSGFLRRLPADTRYWFLVGGALFVFGAIGLEALAAGYVTGSLEVVTPGSDPNTARTDLVYAAITTVEETLEMVGAAVFLTAVVAHIENHLGRRLSFGLPAVRPDGG